MTDRQGAAAALADVYEVTIAGRGPVRCWVPTLVEVARICEIQDRINHAADEVAGRAAQLEMMDAFPRAIGLEPAELRLFPVEFWRLVADFFAQNRLDGTGTTATPATPSPADPGLPSSTT